MVLQVTPKPRFSVTVAMAGISSMGVAERDLDGFAQGGFGAVGVDVVHAEDVGQEDTVEETAFEGFREVGPVGRAPRGGCDWSLGVAP